MRGSLKEPNPFLWLLIVLAIRLAATAVLPVTTDEAYYSNWSRKLAWGYFDHPPMVALGGIPHVLTETWFSTGPLMLRILVVLGSSLFVPVTLVAIAKRLGMESWFLPAFVFCASFAGLISGMLLTPDAFLMMAWAASLLALIDLVSALERRGQGIPWVQSVLCGICLGVGMLAKYTFALMPLITVWMLMLSKTTRAIPVSMRMRSLAITTVTACVVFAPHLAWNARHEWVTFEFQLRHGFAGTHAHDPEKHEADNQPASLRLPYSRGNPQLGDFFQQYDTVMREITRNDDKENKKQVQDSSDQWPDPLRHSSEFLGSQLVALGLLGPAILWTWRRRKPAGIPQGPPVKSRWTAVKLATWTPFIFFGALAPLTHVEANWPAMGFIGLSFLLSMRQPSKAVFLAGVANGVLVFGIAFLAAAPGIRAVVHAKSSRIIEETAGFSSLGALAGTRWNSPRHPLLVDKYQWVAMIRYYAPGSFTQQFRGMTRDSEFTRNPDWQPATRKNWRQLTGLSLLTSDRMVPRIESFAPESIELLCVTQDNRLLILNPKTPEFPAQDGGTETCAKRMILLGYRPW